MLSRIASLLGSAILLLSGLGVVGPASDARAVQYPQTHVVAGRPVSWTPNVQDGFVAALAQAGSKMVAGGSFSAVRAAGSTTNVPRTNLFAFDASNGAIDANFRPTLDGVVNALALAPDGLSVFVGGTFHTVNGVTRNVLTKLSVSNGAIVQAFAATVSGGPVTDMVVRGNTLYLAGRFNRVDGVTRPYLAAVDATTGALDTRLAPTFAGTLNGGSTLVDAIDVTPDGSRMVVVGNFITVDGLDRTQIAQFDLTGSPYSLSDWATDRLKPLCLARFAYYTEDVDYSPDGSYFALVTTGAFTGGVDNGVLCDTTTRWETYAAGAAQQPTWVEYAGGDTQTAIAVTATAIYASGHQRWENNPYAGDQAGPGAVSRLGLAAFDPVNGLPLSWNPTRSVANGSWRGTLLATSQGLWIGTDVTSIARENHGRLAFFPLTGGTTVPPSISGTLPGVLFSVPSKTCASVDPSILYRVNAGGSPLESLDCGPNWQRDTEANPSPLHNAGSNVAAWNAVGSTDASVPDTAPSEIYETERWSPSDSPPMIWTFPVPAGAHVSVRLYLANQYSGTSQPGERIFDVLIDGLTVLNDYDIVADVGDRVGTMKSFDVVSDGSIDITTQHVVENPLINGIEIVDLDATPVLPTPQTHLVKRSFDGSVAGTPTAFGTPGVDWSHARGAFMLDEVLYYGWDDGNLYARSFDGVTLGASQLLNPYVISPGSVFSRITGVFYWRGSIFYAVKGDATMHSRYFEPESGIMGAVQFDVASNGFDWSQSSGLTMANGTLYWATPDGNLHRADFAGGAPQPGTGSVVSGPATGDGQDWRGNGMFVLTGSAPIDTSPPTVPSNLHTTSVTTSQVGLAWNASTDNVAVSSYQVYRDGVLISTIPGTQTSMTDTSVASATTYAYHVVAADAAGNVSGPSADLSVSTPTVTAGFTDGFETGNLSLWDSSQGMSVQSTDVFAGSYAARGTATAGKAFALKTLPSTSTALSAGTSFKIVSQGANAVNLMRFQTAAGGNILTLFVTTAGELKLRNDIAAANVSGYARVSSGVWHQVEVRVTIAGASGTVQVLFDGTPVASLTQTLNLGTGPVGRLILGDNNAGRTHQVLYDEVAVVS